MINIKEEIQALANTYRNTLDFQISNRVNEMDFDKTSHHLIYRVLGISDVEGRTIDIYQNKDRFYINMLAPFYWCNL